MKLENWRKLGWTTRSRLVAGLLMLASVSGCASSINRAPFAEFKNSLVQVSDGTDQVFATLRDRSRQQTLKSMSTTRPTELGLAPSREDPYQVRPSERFYFYKVARFGSGISSLNDALSSYASLLDQLAAPDLISEKDIDDSAKKLNESVVAVSQTLGADTPPRQGIAIFSTAAAELAKQYLRDRQQSTLLKSLRANQSTIDAVAAQGVEWCDTAQATFAQQYFSDFKSLADPHRADTTTSDDLANLILTLNERHLQQTETLRLLRQAYEQLPVAHRQLTSRLEKPEAPLDAISALAERGKRIYALYKDLKALPADSK